MSATVPAIASVESGGFTVTSNGATAEEISTILNPPPAEGDAKGDPLSRAASELGKKGGQAAAAARKAEAKAKAKDAEKAAPGAATAPEKAKSDEAEPADAGDEPDKEKLGKPRDDPKARMLEATRKAAEAKRERDAERLRREAAERELEALKRGAAPAGEKPKEEPARAAKPATERPKPEDFEDYDDYLDARDDYREAQRKARTQAENQVEVRREHFNGQAVALARSIGEAKKADPTFWDGISEEVRDVEPTPIVMSRGEQPDGRAWIADDLMSFPDEAPAVLRALSADPDEFQRIAALSSPRAVTRELAKLVARKSADAATADTSSKLEVSKAPHPVRSVTGAPSTVPRGGFREGMSFDEWIAANPKRAAR